MTTSVSGRYIPVAGNGSKTVNDRHKSMQDNQDESIDSTLEENKADNELDQILEALDPGKGDEKPEPEKKQEGEDFYKKVGTLTFKTEEEYDKWALKAYGENTRLNGELNKLINSTKPEEKKTETKKEVDVTTLRWQIKVEDFFEQNPEAQDYREEMAVFLRTGKANNESGKPDLSIALRKAMIADGKTPAEKVEPQNDNSINERRIMRSGSGDSSRSSYQEESSLKELDSFADSAILRRI